MTQMLKPELPAGYGYQCCGLSLQNIQWEQVGSDLLGVLGKDFMDRVDVLVN